MSNLTFKKWLYRRVELNGPNPYDYNVSRWPLLLLKVCQHMLL